MTIPSTTDDLIAELGRFAYNTEYSVEADMAMNAIETIRQLEKDAARLDYLLAEHATVDSMRGMKGAPVYRLCWPHLSEQQTEWHQSEREAIDNAMQAAQ